MRRSVNSERRDSDAEPRDETFNIFINNVDSFNGKYILSFLNKQGYEDAAAESQDGSLEITSEEHHTPKDVLHEAGCLLKNDVLVDDQQFPEENQEDDSLAFDHLINAKSKGPEVASKYKIFGSLVNHTLDKPEGLFETTFENQEQFKNIITRCDCVIYDISLDESQITKALTALSIIEQEIERHKGTASKQLTPSVMFILISTTMTWALTPRMDPDDPDPLPFVEPDYHRRKPHPNFREHYDCEREVQQKGKRFKGKLRTFVVCSGITYGYEENILSFLFKRAWMNDDFLPVFGDGQNFIPLIHVADLATIICKIVDMPDLRNQYILAVEQTPAALKYIVKYISRALGNGRIQYITQEEAFLYSDVEHDIFDFLTSDIMMEPNFIIQTLEIPWKSEMNFVENIEDIVEEFKRKRNLTPLKIFVHGPPCSGKTKLGHLLSEYYNLQYISMKNIISGFEATLGPALSSMNTVSKESKGSQIKSRASLREKLEKSKHSFLSQQKYMDIEDAEEFLEVPDDDSEEENYQKTVNEENKKRIPKEFLESPLVQRLSEDQEVALLRREMRVNACQNQGFVLDGYPKTFKQAADLFRSDSWLRTSLESEDTSRSGMRGDQRLVPNYVIHLDASDVFLLDRISQAPEHLIQHTHYSERDMVRRLVFFRSHNTPDLGVTSYFQDCDTDIVEIDVSEFPSEDMECIFYICTKIIGPPTSFGLSSKEFEELAVVNDHKEKLRKERELLEQELQRKKERKAIEEKMEVIMKKCHNQNVKDERILAPKIEKYRKFIATKILPTLSEAIMVLAEKSPEDPIDFLAEYLFKNNPRGKMYNPRYTRNGEEMIT